MRIAVIGGGGVRTPLLLNGLAHSDLKVSEFTLYDSDQDRLAIIGSLAQQLCSDVPVRICASSADCLDGANFVFTSIRVGGIEGRARDEAVSLRYGIAGQETVGPAGFALAYRTIPHLVRYAREIERRAPHAWVINFTNPVGIITQAVRSESREKIIGICDTPTELYEDVAHALGLPSSECYFDYFGLNHLGWLREVYHAGEPQLHRLWKDPVRLAGIYRAPLFDADFLATLKLLPTEYLYYYYRPQAAFENISRAPTSRGGFIQQLNAKLFEDIRRPRPDAVGIYEHYLRQRSSSYMQIETGAATASAVSPWASLTGYDRIALAVVRAIHHNSGAIIPLNVSNRGSLAELEHDDVVEVPCVVNANGPLAMHVDPIPDSIRDLLVRVKEYERLTVQAALSGSVDVARKALAANPLIADSQLADRLISAFGIL